MKLQLLLFCSSFMISLSTVHCENSDVRQGRVLNRRYEDPYIEKQLVQEYSQASYTNATETTADDVIEEIISSSRQGRNIEGLDDIYSDSTIKQALDTGNEIEARNLIRDKLCDLGLMQCDEVVHGKRPGFPTRVIYSQPPPGAIYNNRPPPPNHIPRPPNNIPQVPIKGIYGPPKPMPYPPVNQPQQPPRKVGYELNAYESKPVIAQDKYTNANSFYEYEQSPSQIKFGYTEKPTIVVNQGKREAAGVQQNHHIHHHYVHVDGNGNTGGLVDGSKTVLVNTPISEYSAVNQLSSSYQTSGFGATDASSNFNGGFTPMNTLDYKGVNSGNTGIYSANSVKPVYESNYASGSNFDKYQQTSGPAVYTEGTNGIYNSGYKAPAVFTEGTNGIYNSGYKAQATEGTSGIYNSGYNNNNNGAQQSFHSSSPDFYKKELNLNRGSQYSSGNGYTQQQQLNQNNIYSSQKQQQQQLYSKNQYNNIGEQYQGLETAQQNQYDCVCVPFDQCPAQDVVGRRDDLILPLDPRNLPSEIEADHDNSTLKAEITFNNSTSTEVKKISKRDVEKVQGEGAPGIAEGSEKVSFPTSRRRRDTDQKVPASIEKKVSSEGEAEENLSSENDSEGRALNGKRQAYYQPQYPQQQPQQKQCGPRAVCCRKPFKAPPQQIQYNKCGVRNTNGITGRIKNPSYIDGDSEFGEWPWQAAILKKDPKESVYVCGGTLISDSYIVTAAHCVKTYSGFDLRVRLGEWDVNHDVEFYPYVERDVISVHVHPEYYAGTLDNDLAILKLSAPVDLSTNPHVTPACLPDKFTDFSRQRCWTTGWGKDNWEYGKYQNILKEVDVPIIEQNTCQNQLRQTRLGHSYVLNPGFICAGGEEGKDACKGDGGGPLVCERNGVWQLVGAVSWGIGCGQPNVPGVYVRISHYLNWINQITQRY
ncbi:hypothetical protein ACKWTF_004867 [Chironomus riparius]